MIDEHTIIEITYQPSSQGAREMKIEHRILAYNVLIGIGYVIMIVSLIGLAGSL